MKNKNLTSLSTVLMLAVAALALGSCAFFRRQSDLAAIRNAPQFSVDHRSQSMEIGSTQAQFDNPVPFMPLRAADITVLYFPIEDAVCLRYRIDSYTYHQFWDRRGRELFVRAVERYNSDFENRNLRESRIAGTGKAYGTAESLFLIWQSMSFTVRASGNMDVDLGYYFRERAPFFTVTQGNAAHLHTDMSRIHSGERLMFFTRAQASELAALFDQASLRSHFPDVTPAAPRATPTVSPDEY